MHGRNEGTTVWKNKGEDLAQLERKAGPSAVPPNQLFPTLRAVSSY